MTEFSPTTQISPVQIMPKHLQMKYVNRVKVHIESVPCKSILGIPCASAEDDFKFVIEQKGMEVSNTSIITLFSRDANPVADFNVVY